MKRRQGSVAWAPILGLVLTLSGGCASSLKPVKCDEHLEPINKPAFPANARPLAEAPQPAASESPATVRHAGSDSP
jgi:hypothetical protein